MVKPWERTELDGSKDRGNAEPMVTEKYEVGYWRKSVRCCWEATPPPELLQAGEKDGSSGTGVVARRMQVGGASYTNWGRHSGYKDRTLANP